MDGSSIWHLGLIARMVLVIELPVLLSLVSTNLINTAGLTRLRRYAYVAGFAVAAMLTPPGPFGMMMMAISLVGLYEASILFGKIIEKKRA